MVQQDINDMSSDEAASACTNCQLSERRGLITMLLTGQQNLYHCVFEV